MEVAATNFISGLRGPAEPACHQVMQNDPPNRFKEKISLPQSGHDAPAQRRRARARARPAVPSTFATESGRREWNSWTRRQGAENRHSHARMWQRPRFPEMRSKILAGNARLPGITYILLELLTYYKYPSESRLRSESGRMPKPNTRLSAKKSPNAETLNVNSAEPLDLTALQQTPGLMIRILQIQIFDEFFEYFSSVGITPAEHSSPLPNIHR
jgi:hypothetical protein